MDLIDEILDNVKTIAVVGLSDNPARDSHGVSAYMQSQGYRIIPVNPALNRSEVLGRAILRRSGVGICGGAGTGRENRPGGRIP